jgi:RNA polymerase sigma-70 factor, ECF subfamily
MRAFLFRNDLCGHPGAPLDRPRSPFRKHLTGRILALVLERGQLYRPGNVDDFDRLYRATHNRVLYVLLAILRDRAAAEDCAQDTYVHAFKAWGRWRPEARAEAWIHSIAVRTALSHRRHERLREIGEVLRRFGRPRTPGEDDPQEKTSELFTALRRLPPKQAAALVLRHHHGFSNREIGAALGISESTVASRLAAARGRLRRDLAEAQPLALDEIAAERRTNAPSPGHAHRSAV